MPYFPTIAPENIDDFRRWLADELNSINPNIVEGQEYFGFKVHYSEPEKYEIGQLVFASGESGSPTVGWDPGGGQGLFERSDFGWIKLGSGDLGTLSHSGLQDLLVDDHPQYHNDTRGDIRYYTQLISNCCCTYCIFNINHTVYTHHNIWNNIIRLSIFCL